MARDGCAPPPFLPRPAPPRLLHTAARARQYRAAQKKGSRGPEDWHRGGASGQANKGEGG